MYLDLCSMCVDLSVAVLQWNYLLFMLLSANSHEKQVANNLLQLLTANSEYCPCRLCLGGQLWALYHLLFGYETENGDLVVADNFSVSHTYVQSFKHR